MSFSRKLLCHRDLATLLAFAWFCNFQNGFGGADLRFCAEIAFALAPTRVNATSKTTCDIEYDIDRRAWLASGRKMGNCNGGYNSSETEFHVEFP